MGGAQLHGFGCQTPALSQIESRDDLLDGRNSRAAHTQLVDPQTEQDRYSNDLSTDLTAKCHVNAGPLAGIDGMSDHPKDSGLERMSQGCYPRIRSIGGHGILAEIVGADATRQRHAQ